MRDDTLNAVEGYIPKAAELSADDEVTEIKQMEDALKESEARYRFLFEKVPIAIGLSRINGDFVDGNDQIEKIVGYTGEELRREGVNVLYALPEQRDRILEQLKRDDSVRDAEVKMIRKDKRLRIVRLNLDRIEFKGEEMILFTARDITETKYLEHLRDDFINTVAHELRTPMSIIKESLSQIKEGMHGEVNPRQKPMLYLSLKNMDRLIHIVNELLDISRLEKNKIEMERTNFDIVDAAKEVRSIFMPSIQAKGLQIREKFSRDAIKVNGDRDKIMQVFTNLFSNAIKFTEKGYIEISISDDDECVECRVSDTGVGVSEKEIPFMFDKYHQVGKVSRVGGVRGVGLGLAISKEIVDRHDGRIWIESAAGKGSVFAFAIPRKSSRRKHR